MNDKDFLLSFQPKKLEENSDDEIEVLADQKIGALSELDGSMAQSDVLQLEQSAALRVSAAGATSQNKS